MKTIMKFGIWGISFIIIFMAVMFYTNDDVKSHVYFSMAENYDDHGQYSKAIDFYSKFLLIEKNNYLGLLNRGVAYACSNDFEHAQQDFNSAIKQSKGDYRAFYNLGLLKINLKEYKEAYKIFEKCILLGYEKEKSSNNLQLCKKNMGD